MKDKTKDELVASEWLSVNPELSKTSIELVTQFVRFSNQISSARHDFCKQYSLNPSEFDVLATLFRAGLPHELSAKELKDRTLLPSSGALSNRIDRLENKGLVVRRHDLVDKRGVKIRLSEQGISMVEKVSPLFFSVMSDHFIGLENEEQEQLKALMQKLL
ncbi:MarR family winged helix-turn-helix transcriptional regulator [Vibrio gallicus]|uniref:MarR family winged helix-turn-helix transcriptional regulator n=1 Tax=Vibrio gallicus TaxID=190897 RepID=UPI0021C37E86|nr:MarR family transcriptional regulator [Vibrio gallicus]